MLFKFPKVLFGTAVLVILSACGGGGSDPIAAVSPTPEATPTPSETPSPTVVPDSSPTPTVNPSPTPTLAPDPTPSASPTSDPSPNPSPDLTPTPTPSPSPTVPPNHTLNLGDDFFSGDENIVITGTLDGNDGNVGAGAVYELVVEATNGEVIVAENGRFTYLPAPHFDGTDTFTYWVTNDASETGEAQVSISIANTVENITWPSAQLPYGVDSELEARIDTLIADMTLLEKVSQVVQGEIQDVEANDLANVNLGSVLNGGGSAPNNNSSASVSDWLNLADSYFLASSSIANGGQGVPLIWGTDAVHGHNNVRGATIFPHNIGLGAANNPELIKQIGAATALEVSVTGIDWNFAPTLAVARDDRWGRTYESYSENPVLVAEYATAMIEGLQGSVTEGNFLGDGRVVATAKHFIGDGATRNGDDQGNADISLNELRDIHSAGYITAIEAGVQTVMASFNSFQGEKLHGSHYFLTHVLKQQMGFDGYVIGDWNGHGQVEGCSDDECAQAINAGVDMIMVPYEWNNFVQNTYQQALSGEIPLTRIDDAVRRILRVKLRAGLLDGGRPSNRPYAGIASELGSQDHRLLARQAVQQSLVLLKNKNAILPLNRNINVLVAGDGADDIGKQSGGWTVSWQGSTNNNGSFPGATSIYDGIETVVNSAGGTATLSENGSFSGPDPDVAIVVFGEDPYAEGQGDLNNMEYQAGNKSDLALLESLQAQGIPVISVFITGRPLWVNAELNASDAFVVAWLPGTEGQGIADVLFRDASGGINVDFTGRLSFSWPADRNQATINLGDDSSPLFPYGFGLNYQAVDTLGDNLPE